VQVLKSNRYGQRMVDRALADDHFLIPQEVSDPGHVVHCAQMIAMGETQTAADKLLIKTWIRAVYNPCIRLSDLEKKFYSVPYQREDPF